MMDIIYTDLQSEPFTECPSCRYMGYHLYLKRYNEIALMTNVYSRIEDKIVRECNNCGLEWSEILGSRNEYI